MTKKSKFQKSLWENTPELINVNKQLIFLRENKRKIREDQEIYYSEKQNRIDLKHYYRSVAHQEITGLDLFYQYNRLLDKTHTNRIPYFISKDLYLYTWVDLYPDGTVKSIYTGEEKDPKSLILQDNKIISQKYNEYQQFLEQIQHKQFALIKKLKSFERKLKLNAEHIVPQSWFGGGEPMKGDLHHLFICEPECNIARSNFPYDDLYFHESPNQLLDNNCGVIAGGRFEPKNGKGTAARAMLYFLVRYPKVIKKPFRSQINLPLLFRWNQDFPVTIYEKHRNQAIYRIQGNRNPFIDFPNLGEQMVFPLD